jgi:chromate transporter
VAGLNILLRLAGLFGRLSLLAVGGVNSTLPEIARAVVDDRHWMTREQFAQLFAIANAAPGPNMLVVVLIGQSVGGVLGGIVAALAMILPAGILVLLVSGLWDRFRHARWRRVLQAAILPITGGLVLAAAAVLVEAADTSVLWVGVTAVAAGLLYWSKLHPLWVLAAGTVVGLLGGGL